MVRLIILIVMLVLVYIILKKFTNALNHKKVDLYVIQSLSIFILFVIIFASFTSYFYTKKHLTTRGDELLHAYYDLYYSEKVSQVSTDEEKKVLAKNPKKPSMMALDTTVKTVHTIESGEITRGPLNEYTYKVQFIERIDVNDIGQQRMNDRACDITLQWVRWIFLLMK